ncbi:MAG: hypothetical protein M0Q12_00090 [Synergistaceae bacterium]|jgi:hypothetical protein|nr:hypothetical protein [Synergistaceae bacterium]
MVRTEHREIAGKKVMTTQFPAKKALRLFAKILRIAGQPFANILKGVEGQSVKDLAETDVEKLIPLFGDAVAALLQNLDDDETIDLVVSLFEFTRIDGTPIDNDDKFNLFFSGDDLLLMAQSLAFVLAVNFAHFFSELATVLGGLLDQVGVLRKTDREIKE